MLRLNIQNQIKSDSKPDPTACSGPEAVQTVKNHNQTTLFLTAPRGQRLIETTGAGEGPVGSPGDKGQNAGCDWTFSSCRISKLKEGFLPQTFPALILQILRTRL